MKRSAIIGLMLIVLISMSNCNRPEDNLVYDRKYVNELKDIRKEIVLYMTRNYIPGAAYAIAKDGKIIYSEGFGVASQDLDVPVTRNTKFRIGQTTELFTSLAYQLLVEQGVLHADSSIQSYLPDFPEKEYTITLNHLVNHTSGIRPANDTEKKDNGYRLTLQKGLELFSNDALEYPPNASETFSMFNYNLLGAIMEKKTGKNFATIIKEEIIDTLHLTNTVFDNPFRTIKGRSDFFDLSIIAQINNALSADLRYKAPSAGLLSNAEDLAKFGIAVLSSDYINEKVRNKLFTVRKLDSQFDAQIANGWIIDYLRGSLYYGRAGDVTGGGSAILIFPEENLVITAVTNLTTKIEDPPVYNMAIPFLPEPEEINKQNSETAPENSQ